MALCASLVPNRLRGQAASDCPDVTFLRLVGDGSKDAEALCARLGITKLPTLQFYRDGQLLWQKVGVDGATSDLGEVRAAGGSDLHAPCGGSFGRAGAQAQGLPCPDPVSAHPRCLFAARRRACSFSGRWAPAASSPPSTSRTSRVRK